MVGQRLAETQQTVTGSAPRRQRAVGADEPAEVLLHVAECRVDLHQITQLDLAREIPRRSDDKGKDQGNLRIAGGKKGQPLLDFHRGPKVIPDHRKPPAQALVFVALALGQGNAFGVFPHTYQGKTQVCLVTFLLVVQRDQTLADPVRQQAADDGVKHGRPEHVARDRDTEQFDAARHAPENDRERNQADDRAHQAKPQAQGAGGELIEVFGQTLVRVIGVTALLQMVVILVIEPAGEMLLGQPAAPADGQ
ncbi:hypothetical protein ALQ16_200701 [Pseudomonas syringae pv. actinidiae]|nr:hypothetical protein ALQ16_200701 [Pseudomonas syringae pv. actinidiae]